MDQHKVGKAPDSCFWNYPHVGHLYENKKLRRKISTPIKTEGYEQHQNRANVVGKGCDGHSRIFLYQGLRNNDEERAAQTVHKEKARSDQNSLLRGSMSSKERDSKRSQSCNDNP